MRTRSASPWPVVRRAGAALPLAVGIAAAWAAVAFQVGFLVVLAWIVDAVFLGGKGLADVQGALVAMVVLAVGRAAALGAAELLGRAASGRVRTDVRGRVARAAALGAGRPDAVGRRTTDLGEAVESLDDHVAVFLPALVLAVAAPLTVLVAVAILDPWTTIVLVFAAPMLVLLLAVVGSRTRDLARRRLEELGWLSHLFLDVIEGLGTLQAFGRADAAAVIVEDASTRHARTSLDLLRTAFQTSLVLEWAATAATALVAVEVALRLSSGTVTFFPALAVLVLTPEFFIPFRRLSQEYHAGQTGRAALERLAPALDEPVPGGTAAMVAVVAAPRGRGVPPAVELRDVTVHHPDLPAPALDGVSLAVGSGEVVAVTGPTGAGKSTLARLLLGLATPDTGEVLVDGGPLAGTDLTAWRRRLGWMPQRPTLFAGSVADNVALARPGATPEQVRAALAVAGALRFVDALPQGIETPLGEGAFRLSGGQRQRLALARVVLADPGLVLLDEPTAHLDPETEADVVAALRGWLDGRTALVITHRPAAAELGTRVVGLDGGRLVTPGLAVPG